MKQVFSLILLLGFLLTTQGQIPTKLFDVKNGNGAVHSGTTYPDATLIAYKDSVSKSAIIDAFADTYGYQATINGSPNPQNKQAFFNQTLQNFIKGIYKTQKSQVAQNAARVTAEAAADAELP